MTPPSGLVIRPGVPSDAAVLADLAARTFRDTYAEQNTPVDLAAHLATHFSPELQAAELADDAGIVLIAEVDGVAAGYAQLATRPPPAPLPPGGGLFLWRFYLDRSWIGRGLAQPLLAAVLAAGRERGADYLWLTVWQRNPRAVSFYLKSGFAITGTTTFTVGNDPQADWLMTRSIEPNASRPLA
jgi:diamine N-acetyltransferase